jgi:hypothetical protein
MKLIATTTLGTAAANIEFTSIPQDGTDLVLLFSDRLATADDVSIFVEFNNLTSGYNVRRLIGTGSSGISQTFSQQIGAAGTNSNFTSDTFGNHSIYIPNYTGSTAKIWSSDSVTENDATASYQMILGGLSTDTSAITSLLIKVNGGTNLASGSIASLYKISKGSDGIVTTS